MGAVPEYVTIPDVELVGVGMRWDDRMTFRFDHLADAVAAQYDPHIQRPRLTLGHTDPNFNPEPEKKHNPFIELGDGWPAIGSIDNLHLTNDGAMLSGDLAEVPDWLAEVAASAYPTRSIEGAYLDGRWDVETEGGKHYGFVLTAVALGGIWRPAISDLEDLRRYLVEGEGVVVAGTEPEGAVPAARIVAQ
jgi:hypothetical protein